MAVTDELSVRLGIELPIVQAPMAGAGGLSLAVAVAQAGGLGSLPAAMLTSEQLLGQIDEFRHASDAPLNVNFFCHVTPEVSRVQLEAWSDTVSRYDAELGIDRAAMPSGTPRHPFDDDGCWQTVPERSLVAVRADDVTITSLGDKTPSGAKT